MRDILSIVGLVVDAYVGVHAGEKHAPQRIVVDVSIETDTRKAGLSDAIEDTLDYEAIVRAVHEVASKQHYNLIESVAEHIAGALLLEDAERVGAVRVRIAKPGAIFDATAATVEIRRTRGI